MRGVHICPKCGHLFKGSGKYVEVRTGFCDREGSLGETFCDKKNVFYCLGCAPAYDARWEGIYYKEVQCLEDGTIVEVRDMINEISELDNYVKGPNGKFRDGFEEAIRRVKLILENKGV